MKSIITRKIEIFVNCKSREQKDEYYKTLWKWLDIGFRAANIASTNLFVMDNIPNMVYLNSDAKVKIANAANDPDGILNGSNTNSTYKRLSHTFKGDIPTDILACICQNVRKNFSKDRTDSYIGKRSLRSYKQNMPLPFRVSRFKFTEHKNNYTFTLFQIPFCTRLGYDKSNNRAIINLIQSGEYKMCTSSIKYDQENKKWFLLLCVEIPDIKLKTTPGLKVEARLGIDTPIIAECNNREIQIGTIHEFLYQRVQIQQKLSRLQADLRYVRSGKGRKAKLQAIDRFKKKEQNYIRTKLHTYSRILVNHAIRNKAESIVLINQEQKEDIAEENQFVLRNWSYYALKEMIAYKCKRVGIELALEEKEINNK